MTSVEAQLSDVHSRRPPCFRSISVWISLRICLLDATSIPHAICQISPISREFTLLRRSFTNNNHHINPIFVFFNTSCLIVLFPDSSSLLRYHVRAFAPDRFFSVSIRIDWIALGHDYDGSEAWSDMCCEYSIGYSVEGGLWGGS